MASFGAMDDGEWSSFNAIYSSTEEAEFMAQLLANCSLPNDQPNNSNVEFSSTYWPGSESDVNMAVVEESSINSSDDTNADMYYYSFSQGNSYSDAGSNIMFPLSTHHHIYYPSSTTTRPILTRNDSLVSANYDMVESSNTIMNSSDHQMDTEHYQMKKGDDVSEISKKRTRIPLEVQKNSKLIKAKKTDQKLNSTDINIAEDGHLVLQRQNSSRCLSEDDSNASREFNGGVLPAPPSCSKSKGASTALNLNGKTRASRGSATDPQSLYAKKRREKINERLRILQNLVPNGTKVDISTMLEEAVQYIKFLQLQIKLLSSDDLWMYAPIAYNGMNLRLDLKIEATLKS